MNLVILLMILRLNWRRKGSIYHSQVLSYLKVEELSLHFLSKMIKMISLMITKEIDQIETFMEIGTFTIRH